MKEKQKPKIETNPGIDWVNIYEYFLVFVLCAALVMSAILPDSKIARYKLEALEIGAFALFFLWVAGFAFFGRIEIRKTLKFLDVNPDQKLSTAYQKVSPKTLKDSIENYDQIVEFLKDKDLECFLY